MGVSNQAPVAGNDAVATAEDGTLTIPVASLLANDTDADGNQLSIISVGSAPNGTVSLVGGNVVFVPALNFSGVTSFTYRISDGAGGESTATVTVNVAAVADAPTVSASAGAAIEDQPIALNISGALTDTDGSEALTFKISGVPAGASLSVGTNLGGGIWQLSQAQLSGLTLSPPSDYSGSINLTVTAIGSELSNGSTAETSTTLAIEVAPVAEAPDVSAPAASGSAVGGIALTISATAVDADGSESIQSIEIDGVPPSYLLSAGTPPAEDGGAWVLTPAQLAGLTMIPVDPVAGGAHGNFQLSITRDVDRRHRHRDDDSNHAGVDRGSSGCGQRHRFRWVYRGRHGVRGYQRERQS